MLFQRLYLTIIIALFTTTCAVAQGSDSDSDGADCFDILEIIDMQEIGISPQELKLFSTQALTVLAEMNSKDSKEQERQKSATRNNYVELAEAEFDFFRQTHDKIKKVVTNSLTKEQYTKLAMRIYQVCELQREHIRKQVEIEDVLQQMLVLCVYPTLLEFSTQQEHEIINIQKSILVSILKIGVERTELIEEYKNVIDFSRTAESFIGTSEEDTFVQFLQRLLNVTRKPTQEIVEKSNQKLEKLLTDVQKVQLVEIQKNTPEYLRDKILLPRKKDENIPIK
jgi:hypothetical protein